MRLAIHQPVLIALTLFAAACDKNAPPTDNKSSGSEKDKKDDKGDKKDDKGDKKDDKPGDQAAKDKDKDKPAPKEEPAPPPAPPPTCTVNAQKSWAKGVNTLTGLTTTVLGDGKTAIGFAVGNTPQALVVDHGGAGSVMKVKVDPSSTFAKGPKPSEGVRILWRVTPVKVDGKEMNAFVDFRDEFKSTEPEKPKGRVVACGPADSGDEWVQWAGPAYLDDQKFAKEAVGKHLVDGKLLGPNKPYKEIRDCRTFVDPKKDEIWIVGSELAFTMGDGKITGESILFVESGKKKSELPLHRTPLVGDAKNPLGDPWKIANYEVPISHELADGSFLVAARIGGGLVAAELNHDKSVRGTFKQYPGFYTMPDASEDKEDDVLMVALGTGKGNYALRAMRIPGDKKDLPAAFSKVTTDEDDNQSESQPEFIRDVKGQRWVAYIEGGKKPDGTTAKAGHLEIIPINAGFRATGRPYQVTKDEDKATESRLVAQKDGGFIVAFIKDLGEGKGGELVTEDLDCKVEK